MQKNRPSFVSDLLMHSYVDKEDESLVLYCPPHFELLLSDSKRQKEAFEIVSQALFPAKNYKIFFDATASGFSPFALEQELLKQHHENQQKIMRQSLVAQVLDKVALCENVPPLSKN